VTELLAVNDGGAAQKSEPDSIVFHDRPVPPEWEARLREVSPISDTLSWLALRWFAEAERWVLYECVPNEFIERSMRSELEGAHPDTLPDWGRIVSAYQWDMYRKHRVHARPSWVIQGTKGGHKVAFSEPDQELCRAAGLPPHPPAPGDLPYAPFDERVVTQILRMSKLAQAKNSLSEFKKKYGSVAGQKREYREALREARKLALVHYNEQFEEPTEHFVKALRVGELDDAPRTNIDWQKKDELSDEKFVETGRF
jgi:hypothetical protein